MNLALERFALFRGQDLKGRGRFGLEVFARGTEEEETKSVKQFHVASSVLRRFHPAHRYGLRRTLEEFAKMPPKPADASKTRSDQAGRIYFDSRPHRMHHRMGRSVIEGGEFGTVEGSEIHLHLV